MNDKVSFFMIAGELSGDRLGGSLIRNLQEIQAGGIEIRGVGGPSMASVGLESEFPFDELSLVGLTEVVFRVPALLRRIRQTAKSIAAFRPDALITIDCPDFSLRVAAQAKRLMPDLKVIHYVAPTVWAWRPGRARRMARSVDHVLALLPFEPPYFEEVGMTCDFVGHPLVRDFDADRLRRTEREFRDRFGPCGPDKPLVVLLPGSRASEIRRMGPVFGDVIARVAALHHSVQWVVPAAAPVAGMVREMVQNWPGSVSVLDPCTDDDEVDRTRKHVIFSMAQAAFATSGTVTLELARAGCPTVIGYRSSRLTAFLILRLVRIDTANLVNLLIERHAIPEYLLADCTAENVASELSRLLSDSDLRTAQRSAFAEALERLGGGQLDPGRRAAESVLRTIADS